MDFDFICPTRIYFRNEGVAQIGTIIKKDYHFQKVYLVYGGSSLKKSGAYDKITTSLKENKIEFIEYSGIQANPDIVDVRKMVEEMRKFSPDLILACGGGSVLDAAKCAAHGYYYDGDPLDFNKHVVTPLHALPVATILTLAASGSEMSDSCVVSDRAHNFKGGFNSVTNYPLFSLMDPSLTLTVPLYQVGVGLADMFSHSLERYLSNSSIFEPCDELALAVMKEIVIAGKGVLKDPNDIEARRAMMICGSLAHDGFTNYGKSKVMIIHKAEHTLSAKYPELLHGQGIALLMCDYLQVNKKLFKDKIVRLGRVFGLKEKCSVLSVISALKEWLATLPIYQSFEDLPFSMDDKDIQKALKILKRKN